jgi:hypothetical protein
VPKSDFIEMKDNRAAHKQVSSSREIQDLSHQIADDFLEEASIGNALSVRLSFYPTWLDYDAFDHLFLGPVHSIKNNHRLTIHLCEEGLEGIPRAALKGWIEQEIVFHYLGLQSHRYAFNFCEEILPHFYVSGSAVNLIRHVVDHLDKGLRRFDAAEMLIKMGHEMPQLHLSFFRIRLCPEERDVYENMIPHPWVRASFISRKLKDILSISALSSRGIGFSKEVEGLWWQNYEYLLEADRALIGRLREIPIQAGLPHYRRLIKMFLVLRDGILVKKDPTSK